MGRRRNKKSSDSSLKEKFDFFEHPLIQVKTTPELGRYLEAKRDIDAGTRLFQEGPLVIGPAFGAGPVCLACYRQILDTNYRCQGCDWPLCSVECGKVRTSNGHSKEECELLSPSKRKPGDLKEDQQLYGIITPLRALLLKKDKDKWEALTRMDSLNDIRKKDENAWNMTETQIIQVIQECGFYCFDRDDIHTVCGYIQINAFAVERTRAKALYPKVFLLSHDCVPNTAHCIDGNFILNLRSTVDIKKGEKITLSYANTLQGTWQRRKHLKESKYFDCSCRRCSDPTELGTYASAIKCPKCPEGKLLPRDPLDSFSEWSCSDPCGQRISSQAIQTSTDRLLDLTGSNENKTIEDLESLIVSLEKVLHSSHFLVVSVKHTLSQTYGKVAGFMIHEMSIGGLERKIDLCRELLGIFDIIEPGLSRIRGITLYEIHAPLMLLTLQRFQNGSVRSAQLQVKLTEVTRCLKGATEILEFEPSNTPEGQVGLAAKQALRETSRWKSQLGSHR